MTFLPLSCTEYIVCANSALEADATEKGTVYLTCPNCCTTIGWSHDDITMLYLNHMALGVSQLSAPEGKMALGGGDVQG